MNKINPVFEESAALRQRQADLQRVAHKFMIIYLVKDRLHMGDYLAHERFCRESHIDFKIELFNAGIEEDREHVLRLPAYHVYYEEDYVKTCYPETGTEEAVHDVIRLVKQGKKASRGGWHPWFTWTIPKWRRRVAVLGSESSSQ